MNKGNYSQRVILERQIVKLINSAEISRNSLDSMSEISIDKWYKGGESIKGKKNFEIHQKLKDISNKYGYIKDLSMPSDEFIITENMILLEVKSLKELLK